MDEVCDVEFHMKERESRHYHNQVRDSMVIEDSDVVISQPRRSSDDRSAGTIGQGGARATTKIYQPEQSILHLTTYHS